MAYKRRIERAEEVSALRERIHEWRATRKRRSPMPKELWERAATLAGQHGVNPIASALNVSFAGLKQRMVAKGDRHSASKGTFVEIDPSALFTRCETGPRVEVTSRRGDKLIIDLGGGANRDLDIAGLARAFVGQRR